MSARFIDLSETEQQNTIFIMLTSNDNRAQKLAFLFLLADDNKRVLLTPSVEVYVHSHGPSSYDYNFFIQPKKG